jgi:hypothetical protein
MLPMIIKTEMDLEGGRWIEQPLIPKVGLDVGSGT